MTWSRERTIFTVGAVVLVGLLGYSVVLLIGKSHDRYPGLVTHQEVQLSPEIKTLAEQRLAVTQAALRAQTAAGQETDLDLYLAIANDASLLGDLVMTRDYLEKYIASNAINYGVWESYASVLEDMGDYDKAKNAYQEVLENSPSEALYLKYGVFLEQHFASDSQDIIALYEDGIRVYGQKLSFVLRLARWYVVQGDCVQAIAHYKVALSLASSSDVQTEYDSVLQTCKP